MPAERKSILIGSKGIGKTTLFATNSFNNYKDASEVFQEAYNQMEYQNEMQGIVVCHRVFDLLACASSDEERYELYDKATFAIIAFAVNDVASFEDAKTKWYPEVKKYAPKATITLVGLKADTRVNVGETFVSSEEAEAFAKQISPRPYVETSSKLNVNVRLFFQLFLALIAEEYTEVAKTIDVQQLKSLSDAVEADQSTAPELVKYIIEHNIPFVFVSVHIGFLFNGLKDATDETLLKLLQLVESELPNGVLRDLAAKPSAIFSLALEKGFYPSDAGIILQNATIQNAELFVEKLNEKQTATVLEMLNRVSSSVSPTLLIALHRKKNAPIPDEAVSLGFKIACMAQDISLLKGLVELGKPMPNELTFGAIYCENVDIMQFVLPYVDVNARYNKQQTPFMFACEKKLEKMVTVLLETNKVDMSLKDEEGQDCFAYLEKYELKQVYDAWKAKQ